MTPPLDRADSPGWSLSDIYLVLFRHKTGILTCSFIGIALAVAARLLLSPPYQSEAKLFIRYVAETKAPAPAAGLATAKSPDQRGETILDSEMEIITSWDLARQVAEAVGPRTILGDAPPGNELNRAAADIRRDLLVESPPRSSVIRLAYRHRDPQVAPRVLREVIDHYLRLHVEIHRASGTVDEFLTRETDQLRAQLAQTEEDLRRSRNKAGVLSLEDAKRTYTEQIASLRQQIFATQAELAERTAILEELRKRSPTPAAAPTLPVNETVAPTERVEEYRSLVLRLEALHRMEQDLLTQFRDENARVKDVRAQIAAVEKSRAELEATYPQFTRSKLALPPSAAGAPASAETDLETQSIRVAALESKLKLLNTQMNALRAEAAGVDDLEPAIAELRRKKDLAETNYRYYASTLEQARVDEAFGAGRVSNISQIQTPSPAVRDTSGLQKIMLVLGGGGILVGLSWAFVAELYLDRTVKHRTDIERLLHPPVLLSIPDARRPGRSRAPALAALRDGTASEFLRPFHETLRDRLIGFFESNGLDHKPKLVAVTGVGKGVGISTTAAGLARSLSEIGEGNVLLVDMTIGQESARHFVRGTAMCDLDQVLETQSRDPAQVEANLFVVAEGANHEQLSRRLPQRFAHLAPKLRASEFDYIIFDLPAVSPISITPRVAGFMDMLVLVVQSEVTGQDVMQRAAALLGERRVPVAVVLNRTRAYLPAWLKQDSGFEA